MVYYYNVYKKSFSIIFKFNYLKVQREKITHKINKV